MARCARRASAVTLDADGYILDARPGADYEVTVPRHFAVGTHIRKWIVGHRDVERLLAILRRVLRTGRPARAEFTLHFGTRLAPKQAAVYRAAPGRAVVVLAARTEDQRGR